RLAMLSTRFSPMTARPTRAISHAGMSRFSIRISSSPISDRATAVIVMHGAVSFQPEELSVPARSKAAGRLIAQLTHPLGMILHTFRGYDVIRPRPVPGPLRAGGGTSPAWLLDDCGIITAEDAAMPRQVIEPILITARSRERPVPELDVELLARWMDSVF